MTNTQKSPRAHTRGRCLAMMLALWASMAGSAEAASCSDFSDQVESPYWCVPRANPCRVDERRRHAAALCHRCAPHAPPPGLARSSHHRGCAPWRDGMAWSRHPAARALLIFSAWSRLTPSPFLLLSLPSGSTPLAFACTGLRRPSAAGASALPAAATACPRFDA